MVKDLTRDGERKWTFVNWDMDLSFRSPDHYLDPFEKDYLSWKNNGADLQTLIFYRLMEDSIDFRQQFYLELERAITMAERFNVRDTWNNIMKRGGTPESAKEVDAVQQFLKRRLSWLKSSLESVTL